MTKGGIFVEQQHKQLYDNLTSPIRNNELNYNKTGHDNDKIVKEILRREFLEIGYTDFVDLDPMDWARKFDIDFLISGQNKNTLLMEIKADSYKVLSDGLKSIFIEIKSNIQKNIDGWLYTSRCNYFIFYFILYDYYLIIDRQKLLNFMNSNLDKYNKKLSRTFAPDNSKIWYETEGRVVPIYDILQYQIGTIHYSKHKYKNIKEELGM